MQCFIYYWCVDGFFCVGNSLVVMCKEQFSCNIILIFQGIFVKDIVILDNVQKIFLLQKYVDYIVVYGVKKDDYVSLLIFNVYLIQNYII